MKIVQIVAADSDGGLGKHIIELSNALCEKLTVVVIADKSYASQLNECVQFIEFDVAKAKGSILALWRLFQTIQRVAPSVVHAHGNKASLVLARLQPFIKAKTIGTVHWELKKNKDRRIYNRLNAVIGVTGNVLEGISNPRQFIVHNGVSPSPSLIDVDEARNKYSLAADKPVVIAIGRMVKVKGFDILLDAWRGIDATLILVGDGPQLDALKLQSSELKLNERVRFIGHINNAPQLFNAVDLVVVSSLHEGFGYVLAEAMIARKPIVSTAVSFARQILPEECLAEPGDERSLRDRLSVALNDLALLDEKLHPVYEWASKNLTVEKMADNTLGIYCMASKVR